MLIEFSVANFKSIRDRQTLSMVASSGKEMRDSHTFTAPMGGKSDIRLLRSAVIYGANASGKSNFLRALDTMRDIILFPAKGTDSIPVIPFVLDPAKHDKPTEFEMVFVIDGTRYQYGFSVTKERIVEEWLLAYPHGRAQRWFGRVWAGKENKYQWLLGVNLRGDKISWKKAARENVLFLSTATMLNSEQLSPVLAWFQFNLDFTIQWPGGGSGADTYLTSRICAENANTANEVLGFLRKADLGVHGIKVEGFPLNSSHQTTKPINTMARDLANLTSVDFRERTKIVHKDVNDNLINFKLDDESEGTRKIFSLAHDWLMGLAVGCALIADQLDNDLHPALVKHLVSLFNSSKANPNNAQLIFVAHDTSFMDKNILRRDQIWFCEKDKKTQSTEVYPLTDFRPRKGRDNLRAAYLSGGYGALPYLEAVEG